MCLIVLPLFPMCLMIVLIFLFCLSDCSDDLSDSADDLSDYYDVGVSVSSDDLFGFV